MSLKYDSFVFFCYTDHTNMLRETKIENLTWGAKPLAALETPRAWLVATNGKK